VDRQQLKLYVPTKVPWHLLGSVFKARRITDQMHGRNTTTEDEEVDIRRRREVQRLSIGTISELYNKSAVYWYRYYHYIAVFPRPFCTQPRLPPAPLPC
jgi:hypothetical protein